MEFPAFAGMNTHLRRSYKLQSVKAAYGDRFVTMAQSVLRVQGHDENVTRVALEFASASALAEKDSALALAKKDHDIRVREALEEAATKYRLLQLKYLSVSSRFWLEKMFGDFVAYVQPLRQKFRRTKSGINDFLVKNPSVWKKFAAHENISLEFPLNESFPGVSRALLYGRLSDQVHEPPGLVVLRLWNETEYTGEVYLLRDLGAHYSRKLSIEAEPLDLSQALADLMKPDSRQRSCSDEPANDKRQLLKRKWTLRNLIGVYWVASAERV